MRRFRGWKLRLKVNRGGQRNVLLKLADNLRGSDDGALLLGKGHERLRELGVASVLARGGGFAGERYQLRWRAGEHYFLPSYKPRWQLSE